MEACEKRNNYDIMSVSERMAIMIAAKAASSTEGANHDIMSVSEPEACMHGYGERRMAIMNEVHDIMSVSDIVMRRDEKYMELLEQIEDYWTDRAEGYSQVNQEELAGDNRTNWRRELERHFPENRTNETYKILDIGTGPGFFSIILAEAGYQVTAVDYTEAMLEEAKKNAGAFAQKITYCQMDASHLAFADETFDAVVSRNLTWNLEDPEQAYKEWMRVLKKEKNMRKTGRW